MSIITPGTNCWEEWGNRVSQYAKNHASNVEWHNAQSFSITTPDERKIKFDIQYQENGEYYFDMYDIEGLYQRQEFDNLLSAQESVLSFMDEKVFSLNIKEGVIYLGQKWRGKKFPKDAPNPHENIIGWVLETKTDHYARNVLPKNGLYCIELVADSKLLDYDIVKTLGKEACDNKKVGCGHYIKLNALNLVDANEEACRIIKNALTTDPHNARKAQMDRDL